MVIEYVSAPGETRPPIPDGPVLCQATHEMRILHNAFLWGYEQAGPLVRGVAAGDTARSAYVGQWLADLDATLHVHHHSEDELLWELLEQRAPACALHVGQMRAHHAQVQELLDEAGPALERWRTTAAPEHGEALADAYDRMLAVLKLHLRREVVEVMPVAEKVVSEKEWQSLGDHSRGAIPTSRLMPQLGMLFACSSEDDRRAFAAGLPRPVIVMYKLFGRRQFAKQFRTLFPDQAIPPTI